MKKYTIYKITNKLNNMIYIGCHVTKNIDDSYMGSGINIVKAIEEFGEENFIKEILYIFSDREDMLRKEKELVNSEFISRLDTYNVIVGGGFITTDCVVVKDKTGNIFMTHMTDPRYLSGELVSSNKGLITAKDIHNNVFIVDKNDNRWLSGELFGNTKNQIKVIDKNGNKHRVYKSDVRILNGEFTIINKKKKEKKQKVYKYIDLDRNIFYINSDDIEKDDRIISNKIFRITNGYLIVKDINNNRFYLPKDDIRILNGELIKTNKKWKVKKSQSFYGSSNSIGGKIGITNIFTHKRKYITKDQLEDYLSNNWKIGWIYKKQKSSQI